MNEDEKQPEASSTESGVFLTKGMKISIPDFLLRINQDGTLDAPGLILHTGLDMCPYWVQIGYDHLVLCEDAHKRLLDCHASGDSEGMASCLKEEFISGMQAIISGCIAIDAHYATVKTMIKIPKELSEGWRKNQTARHTQIFQVLRIAFLISGRESDQLNGALTQMFEARNRGVHPPSGTKPTIRYPELNQDTDWRYATFRFENARTAIANSMLVLVHTAHNPKPQWDKLAAYCQELLAEITPMKEAWEKRYGKGTI